MENAEMDYVINIIKTKIGNKDINCDNNNQQNNINYNKGDISLGEPSNVSNNVNKEKKCNNIPLLPKLNVTNNITNNNSDKPSENKSCYNNNVNVLPVFNNNKSNNRNTKLVFPKFGIANNINYNTNINQLTYPFKIRPLPKNTNNNYFKSNTLFSNFQRNINAEPLSKTKTESNNNNHNNTNTIHCNQPSSITSHVDNHKPISHLYIRYLNFRPYVDIPKELISENNKTAPKPQTKINYYYKMFGQDCALVRNLLEDNGFVQCPRTSSDFTILWSSIHLKPMLFSTLYKFQKINHFPRSCELTRKDLLYKNISKYKSLFPGTGFNFISDSFLLPNEHKFLEDEISKSPDTLWIAKPFANCQGRGIFLTNNIEDIPALQKLIVSKYIQNPYLIHNKKFDLRCYVLLTSLLPLRIYRFNEGLVRFCVNDYNQHDYKDKCAHLTNYAINKYNKNYIKNTNISQNEYSSSKWNFSSFRSYLTNEGVDVDTLFMKIDDVIIKSILSCENQMLNALFKYAAFPNNCVALFGYDILIDENLNPWLLEINFNPNLHYDAPIDLKIKGELIAEMFDLMRIVPYDLRTDSFGGNFQISNDEVFKNEVFKDMLFKKFEIKRDEREMIWESFEEEKRCKQFVKIFPCVNYFSYQKFFDKERKINTILALIEIERATQKKQKESLFK